MFNLWLSRNPVGPDGPAFTTAPRNKGSNSSRSGCQVAGVRAFVQSPNVQVSAASSYGSYLRDVQCRKQPCRRIEHFAVIAAIGSSLGFDLTLPSETTSDPRAAYQVLIPQRPSDMMLRPAPRISTFGGG